MNYQFRARNLFILAALLLGAHAYASAQPPAPAPTQPRAAQPARKKRLPPGPKGFEQYAGRDASDKLIMGAGSRAGGEPPMPHDAGLKRYILGDLTGAVTAFEQGLRRAPDDAETHYSLAIVLGELDRNEEAAAEFRQALGCNPNDAQRLLATYNLGNAYLDMGRYREAVARYQEVVVLAPTLANPHYNMGLAYAGWGRAVAAAEQFAEALEL